MEHSAFTSTWDGRIDEIRTSTKVFLPIQPDTEAKDFQAVWDTGAMRTAVSSTLISALGSPPPITFVPVGTGGGVVNAPVHLLNIVLPNNVMVPNVQVTELEALNNCDLLIGMDIIAAGDFAITHVNGKACFSFRMPSHKLIDFIPESNLHNLKLRRGPKLASASKKGKKKKK